MSKYRKSWTTAMQEVQESAALQLKMAFDDAGIKIKGTKGGKLVTAICAFDIWKQTHSIAKINLYFVQTPITTLLLKFFLALLFDLNQVL